MFEIGFAELFLLGVIALLVVGPDRLPALARTVGVWVGRAQRLVGQVRADIEREVRADELRKAAKEYSPTGMLGDMRKEVEDFASEVSKPVDIDAKKAESANSGTSDTEPTGPAAAPASDATDTADTNTAPGSGPAVPDAEEADLSNGRAAVKTATDGVTGGPETTPAERDERSAAP
jgi:sec-independent protein translocase protein TatB